MSRQTLLLPTTAAAAAAASASADDDERDDPSHGRVSRANRIDNLLLIIDGDGQRWVSYYEDLESLACCRRTLQ